MTSKKQTKNLTGMFIGVGIFILLALIIVYFFCNIFNDIKEYGKNSLELGCYSAKIESVNRDIDYLNLCSTENCTSYFQSKINNTLSFDCDKFINQVLK